MGPGYRRVDRVSVRQAGAKPVTSLSTILEWQRTLTTMVGGEQSAFDREAR
jgi:hypothetical protein